MTTEGPLFISGPYFSFEPAAIDIGHVDSLDGHDGNELNSHFDTGRGINSEILPFWGVIYMSRSRAKTSDPCRFHPEVVTRSRP